MNSPAAGCALSVVGLGTAVTTPPYAGITRSGSDGRWRRWISHPLSPVGPSSRACSVHPRWYRAGRLSVLEEAAGGVDDVGGVDAGGVQQLGRGAGAGQLADRQVGDGQVGAADAGQRVQDRRPEAALRVVVLDHDQPAAGGLAAAARVAASIGLTE